MCLCAEVRGEITVLVDLCLPAHFNSALKQRTHTLSLSLSLTWEHVTPGYRSLITPAAAVWTLRLELWGVCCGCPLISAEVSKDASIMTAKVTTQNSSAAPYEEEDALDAFSAQLLTDLSGNHFCILWLLYDLIESVCQLVRLNVCVHFFICDTLYQWAHHYQSIFILMICIRLSVSDYLYQSD